MSFIKITEVTFTSPPVAVSYVTFMYRKVVTTDQQWSIINGGNPIPVPLSGILSPPIIINNLTPGQQYEVSAQMKDCGGSQIITTITVPPNIFVCKTPDNLSVNNITHKSAVISWDHVPGATGYRYRVNNGINSPWYTIPLVNSINLSDLESDTLHTVSVLAIHDKTVCLNSDIIFTTLAKIGSLTIQNKTTFSRLDIPQPFYLTLSEPLPIEPGQSASGTLNAIFAGEIPFEIGVKACKAYLYKNDILIQVINATVGVNTFNFIDFNSSDNISIILENDVTIYECAEPENLLVSDITPTEITASWDEVPGATSYQYALFTDVKKPWINLGKVFTTTIPVVPDTSYTLYIRAVIGTKYCEEEAVAEFITPPLP